MNEQEKQEIFLKLWEPLSDKLYMYARALEKTREDAEDLVSETILTCYEYFVKLRDYDNFKAYVFKIARSKFRRKMRRAWLFGKYDEGKASQIPSNEIQPDLPLDIELLYKALGQLPKKQNEAVVLFEISGFTLKEIKEIQGGTLSSIKSRIKRGREKLSQILCKDDKEYNSKNSIINNKTMLISHQAST